MTGPATGGILDLFAGPGGWSEGARMLGLGEVGIDNDAAACDTAEAAGHPRIRGDVYELDTSVTGHVTGLIASPPCPGFSPAGKGLGRLDFVMLLACISEIASGADPRKVIAKARIAQHDERSALTLEPLHWALDLEPEWIALEQVPTVLPLWEAYAVVLRQDGYYVWTGYMQAEQYGVPQTRKRAVLMAAQHPFDPPAPTHSRYHRRTPTRLDPGVESWVSMAQALDWGMTHRPSMTVTGGGTNTGGAEPFGNAARQGMYREMDAGRWQWKPTPAIDGESAEDITWPYHRPSPTIVGSYRPDVVAAPGYRKAGDPPRQRTPGSVRITVEEAAILQSFRPDYPWHGKVGKQFQQIGNAVPPLLAAHIIAALTA